MTLEAQKIKFNNMEIYNSGSDLLFDASAGSVTFTATSGTLRMPNEIVSINDKIINNCPSVSSTSGTNLTIKGLGTGDILFKTPFSQTTASMRIADNNIVYLNNIPTCTVDSSLNNQMLIYDVFDVRTSWVPELKGVNSASTPILGAGGYYRAGNMVWIQGSIDGASTAGITGTNDVRITLPFAVNYTSLNMPQALSLYTWNVGPANTDLTLCIENGSGVPGTSIDYAKVYYKPNNTTNPTTLKISDITTSSRFRFCGTYYIF